jgi:uncharacterized protein (DUF302 family)
MRDQSFADAVAATRDALASEGFGVLTEIDVRETLKKKLDVDFRPYLILGACNPPLAHKALLNEEHIGLLLPCNVVVQEREPGDVEVSIADPQTLFELVGNPELEPVVSDVKARLTRVLAALG